VQPKLHLFGHIHQDRGLWSDGATTFANVTTDKGTHPAMTLDL
jgi:Icc-related predicted phosphoesterase